MMNVQVKDFISRVRVIKLDNRIDAVNAPDLKREFEQMIADGANQFVLDLQDVPFMDSAGLAALVSLLKRARAASGDVKLVAPKDEKAMRILHLTKFDRVFEMMESVETAVASF